MSDRSERLRMAIEAGERQQQQRVQAQEQEITAREQRTATLKKAIESDLIPELRSLQQTFADANRPLDWNRSYNDAASYEFQLTIDDPSSRIERFCMRLRASIDDDHKIRWALETRRANMRTGQDRVELQTPTEIADAILDRYAGNLTREEGR